MIIFSRFLNRRRLYQPLPARAGCRSAEESGEACDGGVSMNELRPNDELGTVFSSLLLKLLSLPAQEKKVTISTPQ